MDRRLKDFRQLTSDTNALVNDEIVRKEAEHVAQIMQDGIASEFWLHLKPKIDGLILDTERRFIDTLAPTYEAYVQWWSRRQALIAVVALPQATEPTRRTDATG